MICSGKEARNLPQIDEEMQSFAWPRLFVFGGALRQPQPCVARRWYLEYN
jgi:hypothetical protein